MYIKIIDYNRYEKSHNEALEIISKYILDEYYLNKDKYDFSKLLIDYKKALFYINGSFDPFSFISSLTKDFPNIEFYLVAEISEFVESWDGQIEYVSELFFGSFLNGKCSYYILNTDFFQFEIPKLYVYFSYINKDNLGIPEHFNLFREVSELTERIKSKNIGPCERSDTFSDFVYERLSHYCPNYYSINPIDYYKWELPYYDDENHKYNNISLLKEDGGLHYQTDLFERKFNIKSHYKFTIVIDTETNGLPSKYQTEFPHLEYPAPIQISWLVYDEYDRVVHFRDYVIKPNGFEISNDSTLIHGITNEIAESTGEDIFLVLQELEDTIKLCDIIVGHNLDFDIKVLEKAAFIYSYSNPSCGRSWTEKGFITTLSAKKFCTMKVAMNLFKFTKYPKLSELYFQIYERNPFGLHNSARDIEITFDVFYHLRSKYFPHQPFPQGLISN